MALTLPASVYASQWQWGHNQMSSSVNTEVTSGFTYWDDQYVHKHSGDWVLHGWLHTDGTACADYEYGVDSDYWAPGDFGCGGYLQNKIVYWSGAGSYLYIDSYDF